MKNLRWYFKSKLQNFYRSREKKKVYIKFKLFNLQHLMILNARASVFQGFIDIKFKMNGLGNILLVEVKIGFLKSLMIDSKLFLIMAHRIRLLIKKLINKSWSINIHICLMTKYFRKKKKIMKMKMKKNERNRTNMSLIKNKFKNYIFVIKIFIQRGINSLKKLRNIIIRYEIIIFL